MRGGVARADDRAAVVVGTMGRSALDELAERAGEALVTEIPTLERMHPLDRASVVDELEGLGLLTVEPLDDDDPRLGARAPGLPPRGLVSSAPPGLAGRAAGSRDRHHLLRRAPHADAVRVVRARS